MCVLVRRWDGDCRYWHHGGNEPREHPACHLYLHHRRRPTDPAHTGVLHPLEVGWGWPWTRSGTLESLYARLCAVVEERCRTGDDLPADDRAGLALVPIVKAMRDKGAFSEYPAIEAHIDAAWLTAPSGRGWGVVRAAVCGLIGEPGALAIPNKPGIEETRAVIGAHLRSTHRIR